MTLVGFGELCRLRVLCHWLAFQRRIGRGRIGLEIGSRGRFGGAGRFALLGLLRRRRQAAQLSLQPVTLTRNRFGIVLDLPQPSIGVLQLARRKLQFLLELLSPCFRLLQL